MILENPIARVYAQALLLVGEERGTLEAMAKDLEALTGYLREHPELQRFLDSPAIDHSAKHDLIREAFGEGLGEEVTNLLHVLIRNRRQWEIRGVADAFRELYLEHERLLKVGVRAAVEPGEEDLADLKRWIEGRTGLGVVFEAKVVPSLLGGIVVRVGDLQFDGSVRSKLKAIRERMQSVKIPKEVAYEA